MKKVCVIGLGYIGLPTAAVLADNGFEVIGVDVNESTVNTINEGKIHIYEPDLDIKVKNAVTNGFLKASIKPSTADVFIIAVPTPLLDNNKPDVSYIKAATKSIAPFIQEGNLIILESTSPIGTTERIAEWLTEERLEININENVYISHCPERVLPGKILEEMINNDRIIGGINELSTEKTVEFYRTFVKGMLLETNARTAEMGKLTENAFRDVNIAFANELSIISDSLDIDVWELIKLANHHPRVNILQPGPGVGGHCIAVDPWFIVDSAPEQATLIRTARNVNDSKPDFIVEKVLKGIKGFDNPKIACLGLSFKANIDDLRESPAVDIIKKLSKIYYLDILVAEPHISKLPSSLNQSNISLVSTEEALRQANVVLLLVDHDYFKTIDYLELQNKLVIDTKGIINNSTYKTLSYT